MIGFKTSLDCARSLHRMIGCHPDVPEAVARGIINIGRFPRGSAPGLYYFESEDDLAAGDWQDMEFRDRRSFREVYRFARIWQVDGIGRRAMP